MYYSKIFLDKNDIIKFKLFDRYAFHRFTWTFFKNQEKRNFLFDVEESNFNQTIVRVLSEENPQLGDVIEIPETFFDLEDYLVEVTFCPTKKDAKTKKRYPLIHQGQIEEWIVSNITKFGLKIGNIKLINRPTTTSYQKGNGRVYRTHVSAQFLINGKKDAVKSLLSSGIGSGKSDGFGMPKINYFPISA